MDSSEVVAFIQSGAALPYCNTVTPALSELINACRALDAAHRPDMWDILMRLQQVQLEAFPLDPWYLDYGRLKFQFGAKSGRLRLGSGAFGEVFAATLEDRKVVVKEFDDDFLKAQKQKFFKEIRLLHSLEHPNIVKMLGASTMYVKDPQQQSPPFIVFEALSMTLFAALFITEPSPLQDCAESLRVASEISSALEYLHSQNPCIVHHDLKPQNVMLTDTLQAKLIDFGVASTVASATAIDASEHIKRCPEVGPAPWGTWRLRS